MSDTFEINYVITVKKNEINHRFTTYIYGNIGILLYVLEMFKLLVECSMKNCSAGLTTGNRANYFCRWHNC